MAQTVIPLAAKRIGSDNELTTPKIVYINVEKISRLDPIPGKTYGCEVTMVDGERPSVYEVYETPREIEAMKDPASTHPEVSNIVDLSMTAAGTTQGAGVAAAPYISQVDAIGAAATEVLDLPAALEGDVRVIYNADVAADTLHIFPASGEFIDGTVNLDVSLELGEKVTYVCQVDTFWETCTDFGR